MAVIRAATGDLLTVLAGFRLLQPASWMTLTVLAVAAATVGCAAFNRAARRPVAAFYRLAPPVLPLGHRNHRPQLRPGALVVNDNGETDYLDYVRDPANGFLSMSLPLKGTTDLSLGSNHADVLADRAEAGTTREVVLSLWQEGWSHHGTTLRVFLPRVSGA